MLKKLSFYIQLCLAVIVMCLLAHPLVIGSVPKDDNKVPTYADQVINNIDASIYKIIAGQGKLEKLVNKLDDYTVQQGMKEGKEGDDWAAAMVIAYEFKQIGFRHLASTALTKQMLYLQKDLFPFYLNKNFDLIIIFFGQSNVDSLKMIKANSKYIFDDALVKEIKEGIKEVEKTHEHLVKIFSNFI